MSGARRRPFAGTLRILSRRFAPPPADCLHDAGGVTGAPHGATGAGTPAASREGAEIGTGCMREFARYVRELGRAVAWCWSGGRLNFVAAVFFLTFGRLFKIAAMFLPIKILLVLSSGHASRYMALIPMDPDTLLIFMAAAIPVSYGIAVIFASRHRHAVHRAKMPAAEKRFKILSKNAAITRKRFPPFFEMTVTSTTNATIIAIAVTLAFLFSPAMGVVNLLLIAAYIAFFVFLIMPKPYRHVSWGRLHSTQVMEYVGILGFFMGFLVIAAFVMIGQMEVYGAILSLLMCRLMFRSIKSFLQTAHRNIRNGVSNREELE